MMRSWPIWKY